MQKKILGILIVILIVLAIIKIKPKKKKVNLSKEDKLRYIDNLTSLKTLKLPWKTLIEPNKI